MSAPLPVKANLEMLAGASYDLVIEFTDGDKPADLSNFEVSIRFGRYVGTAATTELTIANGGVTVQGNVVSAPLSAALTAKLASGVWQMDLLDASGHSLPLYTGDVTINPALKRKTTRA